MHLKTFLLSSTLLLASASVQAAVIGGISGINAIADTVSAANGNFLNWQSVTAADTVDLATLGNDLTDAEVSTYVFSIEPVASIDMAFTATPVYNGAGNDLVLFFVGNGFSFDFDADAGGSGAAINYGVTDTGFGVTDIFGDTWSLSAAQIDLADFGFDSGQQLGDFRVTLGDDLGRPALALVGGFNTQPLVVPVPAALWLFVSGLAALGLFTRRPSC